MAGKVIKNDEKWRQIFRRLISRIQAVIMAEDRGFDKGKQGNEVIFSK
jgi:hypothetical protein